jgi:BlaI family penicillinase repressor
MISESEWRLMEVLWANPGLELSELYAALEGSNWSYSTVRTLLARLQGKGFVRADKSGRFQRYYPAADAADCRKKEAEHFLGRVFGGSITALVSQFMTSGSISEAEREALSALIERMDKDDK